MNTKTKRGEIQKQLVEITNRLEEMKPFLKEPYAGHTDELAAISDDIRESVHAVWSLVDSLVHLYGVAEQNDMQRSFIARLNDLMDDIEDTGNQGYTSVVKVLDLVRIDLESRRPDGSIDFDMTGLLMGQLEKDAAQAQGANPVEPAIEVEERTLPQDDARPDPWQLAPFPIQRDGVAREYIAFVDASSSNEAVSMTQDWLAEYRPYLKFLQGTSRLTLDRTSIVKLLPYLTNFAKTGFYDCGTIEEVKHKHGED